MRWWQPFGVLVLVAVEAGAQPRPPVATDRGTLRIESAGNELVALRAAPVTYASLDRLVVEIQRPLTGRPAIRITRESGRQAIDYVLCVTREGVLVVGQRAHTFDPGRRAYVFDKGEITRSYPPLEREPGWTWLIEFELSRERTVTLELSAAARWPLESVTLAPAPAP